MRSMFRILCALGCMSIATLFAHASETNGTIATGSNMTRVCKNETCSAFGLLNFKPTLNANTGTAQAITITDSGISGHVWGDEIGWVTFSPTGSGVTINPTTGELSGMAFATTGSWINFSPTTVSGGTQVGVTINALGEFVGWAYVSGHHGGWVRFDCGSVNTCIKTDWRPTGSRTVSAGGGGGGGGGIAGSGGVTLPPSTTDICPNIVGVQPTLPVGFGMLSGNCVPIPSAATVFTSLPPSRTIDTGTRSGQGSQALVVVPTVPGAPSVPGRTSLVRGGTQSVPETRGQGDTTPLSPQGTPFLSGNVSHEQHNSIRNGSARDARIAARRTDRLYIEQDKGVMVFLAKSKPIRLADGTELSGYSIVPSFSSVHTQLKGYVYSNGSPISDMALVKQFRSALPEALVPVVIPVSESFAERAFVVLFSWLLPIAEAAEYEFGDSFVTPEDPGIYTYEAVVTLEDGTSSRVTRELAVVPPATLFTHYGLLVPYTSAVSGFVTIERLDLSQGEYVHWEGSDYGVQNPIKTQPDGSFSVTVPSGGYRLRVVAEGFVPRVLTYSFPTTESNTIHDRIEVLCLAHTSFICAWDVKILLICLLCGWGVYLFVRRRRAVVL